MSATPTEVVLADPSQLDVVSDPSAVVVAMLEQSKVMLAECSRLEEATEWRARADALATYTRQRDLGRDTELAATEIVRRCERRIGQLVREGQIGGAIRRRGQTIHPRNQHPRSADRECDDEQQIPSPPTVTKLSQSDLAVGIYPVTDGVTDEQFEKAVAEAKAEKNLSRANVVRKAQVKAGKRPPPEPVEKKPRNINPAEVDQIRELAGEAWTTRQIAGKLCRSEEVIREHSKRNGIEVPADAVVGRTRRVDSNRILSQVAMTLDVGSDRRERFFGD